MSFHRSTCSRTSLARTSIGTVEQCGCGAVHFSVGAVTLRLAPEALVELADLLATATRGVVVERTSVRRELMS